MRRTLNLRLRDADIGIAIRRRMPGEGIGGRGGGGLRANAQIDCAARIRKGHKPLISLCAFSPVSSNMQTLWGRLA